MINDLLEEHERKGLVKEILKTFTKKIVSFNRIEYIALKHIPEDSKGIDSFKYFDLYLDNVNESVKEYAEQLRFVETKKGYILRK